MAQVTVCSPKRSASLGTDSFQQLMPRYRELYEGWGVAVVPYGPMVAEMPANHAVQYYKPDVVIGCWVTHKYDPQQHERGGNEVGIDEPDILRHCAAYVLVGHERIHKDKFIWNREHSIEYPDFVYSRAMPGARDFIAVFPGSKGA